MVEKLNISFNTILAYDMVPLIEEILISAFFTKMGNRPPSNKTGPNQLIWTDSENSKELKTVYDKLLSSKIFSGFFKYPEAATV